MLPSTLTLPSGDCCHQPSFFNVFMFLECCHKLSLNFTNNYIFNQASQGCDCSGQDEEHGKVWMKQRDQHFLLHHHHHHHLSWPELSLSKCSEFNSENPVIRQLDLLGALKVNMVLHVIVSAWTFYENKYISFVSVHIDVEHMGSNEAGVKWGKLHGVWHEAGILQHHWQESLRKVENLPLFISKSVKILKRLIQRWNWSLVCFQPTGTNCIFCRRSTEDHQVTK